jgi:hypothetical protein
VKKLPGALAVVTLASGCQCSPPPLPDCGFDAGDLSRTCSGECYIDTGSRERFLSDGGTEQYCQPADSGFEPICIC